MNPILELRSIRYQYTKDVPILTDLTLSVAKGEIACLLGPSGCGKTTALRIIAGFEKPFAGEVRIAGEVVSCLRCFLPPEKRSVGVVFQDAALFPHLTVGKNIAFGLRGFSASARRTRVLELLALMNLSSFGGKYPHQLSGGQKQRVALARAMAPKPALILLDEPFSNLDAGLRESLGAELRRILKTNEMTAVLVTHDQSEAYAMADRIGILDAGRIRQVGSASALFNQPIDRFVAEFLGEGVFIRGVSNELGDLDCVFGKLKAQNSFLPVGPVDILIRPENPVPDAKGITAEITAVHFRGSYNLYHLRLRDGQELKAQLHFVDGFPVKGSTIRISLHNRTVSAFVPE